MTTGQLLDLPRIPDPRGFGPRVVSLSQRLENGPSGVFGFYEPKEARFDHRLDRADEHVARGRWDLAERMYEQVLADYPHNRRALNGVARVYATKGKRRKLLTACYSWLEALEQQSQWSLIEAVGEAILRFDATSEKARLHIALARLQSKDFGGALANLRELSLLLLERAWLVVPSDFPTGMALAEVYILTGNFDLAGQHLRNLASVLIERGQDELAAEVFQRLMVISPERADVALSLGRLYLAMGRYPAAIGEFRSLLRHPGDPRPALLLLAEACLLNKQFEDAALAARKILSLDPECPEARSLLGTAYLGLGLPDQALELMPAPSRAPEPMAQEPELVLPGPDIPPGPCVPESFQMPALPILPLCDELPPLPVLPCLASGSEGVLETLGPVAVGLDFSELAVEQAAGQVAHAAPEELRSALEPILPTAPACEPALPTLPLPGVASDEAPPNPLLLRHGIQAAARLLDDPWLNPEERVEALDCLCQAVRYYARSLPRDRRQATWSAQEQQIEQAVAVLRPVPLDGNLVRLTLWRGIQAAGALLSEPRLAWERKLEAQTVLALAAEAYARAIPCERAEDAYQALDRLLHNHDWSRSLGPSQRLAVWRGIQACGTLMLEREDSPEDRVRLLETLCQAGRLYALEVPLPDPNAAFEALARVLYATDPRLTDGPLTQHALWKGIQAAGGLLDDPDYPAERRQEVLGALCETARAFARLAPPPQPDALDRLKSDYFLS
ncbi:hypothetical protein DYH09_14210 [bacterium CPR1]|nr:hypothetical protein [bacterium CPR1]